MPLPVKLIFSLIVLGVAYGSSLFLKSLGQDLSSSLALFLGVFSVFPSGSSQKSSTKRGTRADCSMFS